MSVYRVGVLTTYGIYLYPQARNQGDKEMYYPSIKAARNALRQITNLVRFPIVETSIIEYEVIKKGAVHE